MQKQSSLKPPLVPDPQCTDFIVLCEPFLLGGDSPVWRFWCPYCRHHHTHGVGEGGRVPHCTDRGTPNPYTRNGQYYLKLDPRFA
jgi:hypothetical protein